MSGLDLLVEPFAFEEGHRDKRLALDLADLVDVADVGMIQRGGCFGLSPETGFAFLITEQVGRKELQSDGTFEVGVLRLVDNAHAALAEFLGDLVVRDGLADHGGPVVLLAIEMKRLEILAGRQGFEPR